MSQAGGPPNVFDYTDYRKYLEDFYIYKKNEISGYSYRRFSLAGGFKSPNILKLVIGQERNIGNNSIENFVKALRLTGSQAEYFTLLVRLSNARSDYLRNDILKNLKALLPRSKSKTLDKEGARFLSHWLFPVVRELANFKSFSADPYWIHHILLEKQDVEVIRSCLSYLIEKGFIKKNASGGFYPSDAIIESTDEIDSLNIRNFHRLVLDQAKLALESVPLADREFGAFTISVSREKIPMLKNKIKNFRHELYEIISKDRPQHAADTVLQVNFQMFPQTSSAKPPKGKN